MFVFCIYIIVRYFRQITCNESSALGIVAVVGKQFFTLTSFNKFITFCQKCNAFVMLTLENDNGALQI